MSDEKRTNQWIFFAMAAAIGIAIGFFGDAMEKWIESFSFISEDGWVGFVFPGVAIGIIGGLGFGLVQFVVSKWRRKAGK